MIDQIVKWQPFFEILKLCISDVIDLFQIEVIMLSQILVTIGQLVKKWQQFSKSTMAADAMLNYGCVDFFDNTDVILI